MKLLDRWPAAARRTDWFSLTRHDDDPAPAESAQPDGDEPDPQEPDPAEPDDQLGDAGKRALQKERAEKSAAKKLAAAEKKRADELARQVQEFQDRDKSELEKATSRADAAHKRAEAATARAIRAEVKALAGDFADVDDALVHLGAQLGNYADEAGDIDEGAIKADLADLLERKPHLRRQQPSEPPEPKRSPRPDPSQGARKDPAPTDFSKASKDEMRQELAKYGVRLRT